MAAVGAGVTACDKIPFLGKKEEAKAPTPAPGAETDDTTAAPATPVPAAETPATTPTEPPPARTVSVAGEEPWTPTQTGIVNPGMTRDEVIGVWGPPVAESATADRTYLYFRNGCERSCGTFDVVMLQGGQVVDAIVRGEGHTYSGTSSSPPGRTPQPTDVIQLPTGGSGAAS
jgi:hypothetical protein